MSNPIIIAGKKYFTGLNIDPTHSTKLKAFSTVQAALSRQEIIDLAMDSDRVRMREFFPYSVWGKNQGGRGACNGFAAASCLERERVKCGLDGVHLSGEFIYAHINGGRDQGSMLDDGMDHLLKVGTCRADLVPHEEYLLNRISQAAKEDAKRFKAFECYHLSTEIELATALALGWTCVVAVHVGGGYQQLDQYGIRGASAGPGNHAVCIQDVVVVNNEFCFDEVGSWANGFAYLTWQRHLKYTVGNHYFYACRAVVDDPQATNPLVIQ